MTDDWNISASKLKTVEACQERFRLEYVEGYRDFGPENRYIRRGNAVHESIERALTSEEYDPGNSAHLKQAFRALGGASAWTLSDDDHEMVLGCLDVAARAVRKHVDGIRGVEMEVEFGVDRATITRDFGGYMDLATNDAVIDWKTGKSDGKEDHEALQGAVYMAGYYEEFGEPPERIVFAYLNEGAGDDHPKTREIEPDDDAWEFLLGRARKLLAVYDSGEYEPNPGEACHWCDVEPFCAASPVGVGNVPWEVYP